ncbi:MAG: hypothetical protein WDN24_12590 [Sphingomonas sp.]
MTRSTTSMISPDRVWNCVSSSTVASPSSSPSRICPSVTSVAGGLVGDERRADQLARAVRAEQRRRGLVGVADRRGAGGARDQTGVGTAPVPEHRMRRRPVRFPDRKASGVEDGAVALLGAATVLGGGAVPHRKQRGDADRDQADRQPHRRRSQRLAPMADEIGGDRHRHAGRARGEDRAALVAARRDHTTVV